MLRGVAWPGFNQQPPGLEGLYVGQTALEATDLHAIVYQMKLLGERGSSSSSCPVEALYHPASMICTLSES